MFVGLSQLVETTCIKLVDKSLDNQLASSLLTADLLSSSDTNAKFSAWAGCSDTDRTENLKLVEIFPQIFG